VRETFLRLGPFSPPEPIEAIAGDAWGYRLRTRLHTAPGEDGVRVGYYARRSHDLVAIERCPVCGPELEQAALALAGVLGAGSPRRIDLAAGDRGETTTAPVIRGVRHGEVSVRVADLELAFDARCFFQGHRGLLDDLVRCAAGEWHGVEAFDLFGGVGLFALAMSSRYQRVTTVDSDRVASRFARINARRNRRTNLEVVSRAVESWIPQLPAGCDRVIVDPPRGGLSSGIREVLLERSPRRLTYVSCHAATMARDLGELLPAFELERVTVLDMFPQTGHVEVVGQLVSRGAG
jgi:23S rRNA (uracil1939-C5)-methyltransferase